MAFATAADEVSRTASGRLMTIEAMNPSMIVFMVAAVCQPMLPATATQSRQMTLGAGNRNAGILKTCTAASQRITNAVITASGTSASRAPRASQPDLRGAALVGAVSEDELTDAMGAALEFGMALELEAARARERHVDDLGDAARTCPHHHHPVRAQHRPRYRMR